MLCRRRSSASEPERSLVNNVAHNPLSILDFGLDTTYNNYILVEPDSGSYLVYVPYVWNHQCFVYKKPGHVRLVLVGFLLLHGSTRCELHGAFHVERQCS